MLHEVLRTIGLPQLERPIVETMIAVNNTLAGTPRVYFEGRQAGMNADESFAADMRHITGSDDPQSWVGERVRIQAINGELRAEKVTRP